MRVKSKAVRLFRSNPGKYYSFKEMGRLLHIKQKQNGELRSAIRDLLNRGVISRDSRGRYGSKDQLESGTLSLSRRGFGFVHFGEEELYVPPMKLNGAMNGDTVKFRVEYFRGRPEARITDVVDRSQRRIVGIAFRGYMIPLDGTLPDNISLSYPPGTEKIPENSVVVGKITSYNPITCMLEKVMGPPEDPAHDDKIVYAMFQLEEKPFVMGDDEVEQLKKAAEQEMRERQDLTRLLTFTVDPADARDHDDAVSVRKTPEGWKLHVHIADVSFYVKEGSAIDDDAFRRGFSSYCTDIYSPMLPTAMTKELCSLTEGKKSLAMTAEMDVAKDGEIKKAVIYPSVVKVNAFLSYRELQDILERKGHEYAAAAKEMLDCAGALNGSRRRRGALELETPENRIVLDSGKNPVEIIRERRTDAHGIIEEFMIAANEAVSETIEKSGKSTLFRIHEDPAEDALTKLRETLDAGGIRIKGRIDLNAVLAQTAHMDSAPYIRMKVLRSMKQARYSTVNRGHFGLKSLSYTHFTSPIRRYSDLVLHRILKGREYERRELDDIARTMSEAERNINKAAMKSYEIKALRWLEEHKDEVYAGIVVNADAGSVTVELIDILVRGTVFYSKIAMDPERLFPGSVVSVRALHTEPLFGYAELEITDERTTYEL